MCFSSAPAIPMQQPAAVPTVREGNIQGQQRRQQAAGANAKSGYASTIKTGASGDETEAPVYKQKLGQ